MLDVVAFCVLSDDVGWLDVEPLDVSRLVSLSYGIGSAVGCRWTLDVGCCWMSLDVVGCWKSVKEKEKTHWMLDVVDIECCLMLCDVGCRWVLLDAVGCHWMLDI